MSRARIQHATFAHPVVVVKLLTGQINRENISDVSELLPEKLDEGSVPRWARVSSAGDGGKRQPDDAVRLEALDVLLLVTHQAHLDPLYCLPVKGYSVFDHPTRDGATVVPETFLFPRF